MEETLYQKIGVLTINIYLRLQISSLFHECLIRIRIVAKPTIPKVAHVFSEMTAIIYWQINE